MTIDSPLVQPTPNSNPTGRGGTLGLLASKLATGLAKRKKTLAAQDAQQRQSLTSQALSQPRTPNQVGGPNTPLPK